MTNMVVFMGNKSNRVRTTDAFSGELPAYRLKKSDGRRWSRGRKRRRRKGIGGKLMGVQENARNKEIKKEKGEEKEEEKETR